MDIHTLTQFFMWCTILNAALLVLSVLLFMLMPNFIYRMQSAFFPVPRETFNTVMYAFLGCHKIAIIIFCFVPYLALLILG